MTTTTSSIRDRIETQLDPHGMIRDEVRLTGRDGCLHGIGAIPDDGIVAGHAGRAYIGPLRYASDGEEM